MNFVAKLLLFLGACGACAWRIATLWMSDSNPEPPKTLSIVKGRVWIRYQGIFGTPWTDGNWSGWSYLYNAATNESFNAPSEIPSTLFPRTGPYSCHDPALLANHTQMIEAAGIDGIIVEWYGRDGADPITLSPSNFTDVTLSMLLDACATRKLRVGVEIAYFPGRNETTTAAALDYFFEKHAQHPAILKHRGRPVVLINEARQVNKIWEMIRGRRAYFLAGFGTPDEIGIANEDGFNAIYPSVASDGYRWSSNITQWPAARDLARKRGLDFVPRVAPGFNETATRRWMDLRAQRSREDGLYYQRMWSIAAGLQPTAVIIDSFNDWFRGTAIEPSVSMQGYEHTSNTWTDGADTDGRYYLDRTKLFCQFFKERE